MPDTILDEVRVSKLGDLARDMADAPVSEHVHAEGRNRILAAADSEVVPRRVIELRTRITLGVFAAAAAALLVFWSALRSRPITYDIAGGSSFNSGYLSASPDRAALIRFSDGSLINASPGSRLRVDSTTTDGARVLLERGAADVQVHHGKTSHWLFIAGPFEVEVVGTRFNLTWDPAKEEVELSLEEGAVRLKSPLGQGPFEVRKGQKFHASLLNRTIRMEDQQAAENAVTAEPSTREPPTERAQTNSVPENIPANDTPGSAANGPQPGQVRPVPGARQDSFQTLVSHGKFQAVVDAAEARGIDDCLQTCSLTDVRALADAARYTGHSGVAEKSLLAIRQRAPVGSQRSAAAFLLGRTSESRGQAAAASRWYDNYLAESPSGEFAADALAGKMRVTVQTQGNAAARPLAMQYLQRYPNGVHADSARKIVEIH
jgi:hypothetical protein